MSGMDRPASEQPLDQDSALVGIPAYVRAGTTLGDKYYFVELKSVRPQIHFHLQQTNKNVSSGVKLGDRSPSNAPSPRFGASERRRLSLAPTCMCAAYTCARAQLTRRWGRHPRLPFVGRRGVSHHVLSPARCCTCAQMGLG